MCQAHTTALRRHHDAGAVTILYADAIGLRQGVDPRDGRLRRRAACQHGSSALAARPPETLLDRMDTNLIKFAARIVAGRRDVLPIGFMRNVALLAIAGAGVEEVGGRRIIAESEPVISRRGKK